MRQVHRTAIGAGFGILAAAGIASSGAFACTREARLVTATGVTQPVLAPGEVLTVTSASFKAPGTGAGNIEFQWVSPDGTALSTLATISASAVQTAPGSTASYVAETNTTSLTFTVPASATTTPNNKPYWVRGMQVQDGRDIPFNAVVPVFIPDGYSATHEPTGGAGGGTGDTGTEGAGRHGQSLSDNTTETVGVGEALVSAGVVAAPERKLAPPVADPSPPAPQMADLPVVAGTPRVSPVAKDDPSPPAVPEPREFQLWSGLMTSASPHSLLDGPQPPSPMSSGNPAGLVLLSMGFLALAGTGAAVGRRRLALARAARR